MKKKGKFQNWILTFGAVGALIGMLASQFMTGGFDLSGLLGALTAIIILITIDIIRNWRKKDSTPEFDERTTNNIIKFYAYASNGFILLALLVFSFLSFGGFDHVSVLSVLIILFVYFSLSGTTAFIISRK